jgi:hypothetical protein
LKRGNQLEKFIDSVAIRESKAQVFRAWKVYLAAEKFRRQVEI